MVRELKQFFFFGVSIFHNSNHFLLCHKNDDGSNFIYLLFWANVLNMLPKVGGIMFKGLSKKTPKDIFSSFV